LISAEFCQAEVASSLGIPKEQISEDMNALRWEIRHQTR